MGRRSKRAGKEETMMEQMNSNELRRKKKRI
jgi:hypothetical protein